MDIKHIMIDVETWAGSTFWLAGLDGPLPIGDIIYVGGIGTCVVIDVVGGVMYLAKKQNLATKKKLLIYLLGQKVRNHVQARVVRNLLNELWTNDMEKITIEQDLVQV